jgi:hypothetical protein
MSTSTIVAVLASLVIGAAIGWYAASSPSSGTSPLTSGEAAPARGSQDEVRLEADADFATQRLAELETKLETVTAEREALRKIIADAGLTDEGAPDEAARIAQAAALKGPRFVFEGMEAPLSEMKWKTIAESVVAMGPLMGELGQALADGKSAGDLPQRIQKYNVPLIQAAVAASQGGMPGHGINGAFTHPALVANMVYSTLLEAGQPLDDGQVEKLGQIADRFVAEDARMRAGVGEESWALEQLVLESEIKDRFYKAVDAILTPPQVDVLHPPSLRDRTAGDIFSAGLIWLQSAQVGRAAGPDDLAQKITAGLMRQFQVPEEEKDAVARAVGDWASGFGPDVFTPLDPLEKNNMVKMDRIRTAGRPMVALYKELVRSLPAQEEVGQRIRASAFLVVPAGQ